MNSKEGNPRSNHADPLESGQSNVVSRTPEQGSWLLNTVTKASVAGGAAMYVEGAVNNGPADALAGAAVAGIAVAVYATHILRRSQS